MHPQEETSNLQAVSPLTVMVDDNTVVEASGDNDEVVVKGNDTSTPSPNATKKPRSKWKKAEDKPHHPRTGYNFFFQLERERMLLGIDHIPITPQDVINLQAGAPRAVGTKATSPYETDRPIHSKAVVGEKLGFADLARNIASKWKALDPELKKLFEEKADKERARYKRELEEWNEVQKLKRNQPELVRNLSSRSLLPLHEQNPSPRSVCSVGKSLNGYPLSSLQTNLSNVTSENMNTHGGLTQVFHHEPTSRQLTMSFDNVVSPQREGWTSPSARTGNLEEELAWHLAQRRGVTPSTESVMGINFRHDANKEQPSFRRCADRGSANEHSSPSSLMNNLPSKINLFIEESCCVSEDLHELAKISVYERTLSPQLREIERQIDFCINEARRLSTRVRDFVSLSRKEAFVDHSARLRALSQEPYPQGNQVSSGQLQHGFDIPSLMNEVRNAMDCSGQLDEVEFRQRLENRKRMLEFELANHTSSKKQCRVNRDVTDVPITRRVSDMSESKEQQQNYGPSSDLGKNLDSMRYNENLSDLLGSMFQKHNFGRDGYASLSSKLEHTTKEGMHYRASRKMAASDRNGSSSDGRMYGDDIRLDAGFESDFEDTSVIGNMEYDQAFDVETMFAASQNTAC